MFNKFFIGFGLLLFLLFLLLLGLIFYFLFIKNKYLNKMCGCNKNNKDSIREGFKNEGKGDSGNSGSGGWSDDLICRFASYQNTSNDNRNSYNMEVIQQHASPSEAEALIKTGYWPWSDDTKYEYMDSIWHHKIIKVNINNALDYAMKTYNESAIKQLMSWNTKEGQFLLYGGKGNNYDTIKCSTDESNNAAVIGIIKKEFKDDYIENSVPISNEDIPLKMPGFTFLKGPCNPCVALHNDYSCPFKLNVKGDDTTSSVWSRLWS